MGKKIVGFKKFTSKKGNECVWCYCVTDSDSTVTGQKVETILVNSEGVSLFDSEKVIGKQLLGFFGYSNGLMVVQGPQIK